MNVERNFSMGATGPNNDRNSLTVSDTGALNIGFGTEGNLAGQDSDIEIVGGLTDVDISGNLILSGGVDGTDLTFDFEGGVVNDFLFDVAGNAVLGGADLFLSSNGTELTNVSPGVLSVYSGNILLIDAGTNIGDTVFSNVGEGDAFGAYTFTYALGGAAGQIGLTVIPEPSSLAVLSLGCFGLLRRRKRELPSIPSRA